MTLSSRGTIQIETPEIDIGDTRGRIRSWLDANKIEPIEFKTARQGNAMISFIILFRSEAEAALFERDFSLASSN